MELALAWEMLVASLAWAGAGLSGLGPSPELLAAFRRRHKDVQPRNRGS
ncbi:MAG TPA: hypothetical protein VGX25_01910 [Actinophytocola sp.]|nr:hypothetical protein [Actinophytocola sp.]HEV2778133.1 hypothetical protein [Actinophytocola sp.]